MAFGPEQIAPYPTQPITGRPTFRTPPRYFDFASPSSKNPQHRNGISPERIRQLVKQYGNNILIGLDMGRTGFTVNDVQMNRESFRVAKDLGVRLHAYLGGPCGPTGNRIEAGEANFMRETAQKLGINTNSSNWMNEWNSWGWKEATKRQLGVIKQLGFESYEMDNLWRDKKYAAAFNQDMRSHDTAGPAATRAMIDLYKEASSWEPSLKITMKNLSVMETQGIEQAMARKELKRSQFADFHISEENYSRHWPALEKASARMGIQLARSHDTYNYACSTEYKSGLEVAANQFLGVVADVVTAPFRAVASLFGANIPAPSSLSAPQPATHAAKGTTYHVDPAAVKINTAPAPYAQTQAPRPAAPALHPVQGREQPVASEWRFNAPAAQQQPALSGWRYKPTEAAEPAPRQRPA